MTDPVAAFLVAAAVPREGAHVSGTLEEAELILTQFPDVARCTIHIAAVRGDVEAVRGFVANDAGLAVLKGGPHDWDPLTYLCFSRYLRIDRARSDAFVATARVLLEAGASAKTGWYEAIDHPNPRQVFESALYGASGVARDVALTRLLLEHGADPNDEETPYHALEGDDDIVRVLVESGTVNASNLAVMLLRASDWHDRDMLRLLLEHGADPTLRTQFGYNALHQAIRRDNALPMIEALLDRGADPALVDAHDGRSATAMAARRGRRSVLELFALRGKVVELHGVDGLIAACALDDPAGMQTLMSVEPALVGELLDQGGTLLAEFAGVGNLAGVRHLLDCGVSPSAVFEEGDGYFGIARRSTALHVAAWRLWPEVVKELIARGAPVDAVDGNGRTALALAVKACVDSHWTMKRTPDVAKALLDAGASIAGITIPSGYDEVDALLRRHADRAGGP